MLLCIYSVIRRSQMMSKCGKNKRKKGGAHKAIAKCVTDVPNATGNKRETNVSLTSPQTLDHWGKKTATKAKRT